jgi:hypothetical protein
MTREEAIERFSKYYSPVGDLRGNPTLHVGHQSFSFDWEEDPEEGDSEARRKWFGDMLCIALARMFEEQVNRD